MNPLKASWTRKKATKEDPTRKGDAPFLGVRNAAQEGAGVGDVVLIEVRGVPGLPSGQFKVRYSPGASLRWYLRCLRMLSIAVKMAIYDVGLPGKGRLRLRYQPSPTSKILLLPPGLSPNMHLQRSTIDAQKVASKMKTDT